MIDLSVVKLSLFDLLCGSDCLWDRIVSLGMARLRAEFSKCLMHHLSVADVLNFLKLFCCVFDQELDALSVILSVLSVDQVIDSAGDASALVGRHDEHLGDFGSIPIKAKVSFIDSEERHQFLRRLLVYHEVVPERTWLDNHSAFDKERQESLGVEILRVEGLI